MHNRLEGMLFDKDGTLFDFQATWGAWAGDFIHTLANGDDTLGDGLAELLGYDRRRGVFRPDSFVVTESMETVIGVLHKALPHWSAEALYDYVNTSTCTAPQAPVVPLAPLLGDLRGRGLKLGVATNDNAVPARAHLEAAGVLQSFDFIASCDSGFGAKPAPGMLLAFGRALEIAPENIAMVGDSVHDMRAGRAAGMVCIGVTSGTVGAEVLAPFADVVLPDIGHIPGWLYG